MSDASLVEEPSPSRGPSARVVVAALVAIVVAAYYPVVTFDFVAWDDSYHLIGNPRMNPPRLSAVGYYWRHAFLELYIPVTYTCWTLVAMAGWVSDGRGGFELNPQVFHAANLAMHVLAAVMAWTILQRLTRDRLAAGLGAAVFAVHPLTVEAVAWVSGFRDVLGGFLALVSVYCFMRAVDGENSRGRVWGWYAAATTAYALAVLSKPASVSTQVVAGAVAVWVVGRPAMRIALWLAPWAAIAGTIVLITRHVQHLPGPQDMPGVGGRLMVAGDAIAFYLHKLVAPISLCLHYGRTPSSVLTSGIAWKTSLVTLAVAILVILIGMRQKRRWAWAAGVMFLAGPLPTLGLVPFAYQTFSTVADRYAYLGLLGVGLAVAFLLAARRSQWPVVVATIAVIGLATLTHRQAKTWQWSGTLFEHAITVNPTSSVSLNGLSAVRLSQGNIPEAERLARTAVHSSGGDPRSLTCLALALLAQGRWEEAQSCYAQAAINGSPLDSAKAYAALADLRAENGFPADAETFYRKALELDPGHERATKGLERLTSRPSAP